MPQWWRAFQASSRCWDVSLDSKYNNNSSHAFHIHYVRYINKSFSNLRTSCWGGPEMTFIFPFRALITPEWNSVAPASLSASCSQTIPLVFRASCERK